MVAPGTGAWTHSARSVCATHAQACCEVSHCFGAACWPERVLRPTPLVPTKTLT